MSPYIQVVSTAPNRELALAIARRLVELQLAACVQISGPITSTYRWEGKIETADEWQCVAKCRAATFAEIEREIIQLHPYDVPEILAFPIVAGSRAYLDWLTAETAAPAKSE